MSTPSFHTGGQSEQNGLRLVHPETLEGGTMRYRLDVIASCVGDVVQSAGGWLFDRAVAGWEVNVCLFDARDARPLRILGAKTLDLTSVLESIKKTPLDRALAVTVDAFATDARTRATVVDVLNEAGEVALWGDGWPAELEHRIQVVQHRLSSAACAFKAHALAAAAITQDVVSPIESYRAQLGRRRRPAASG
jgi:hypothetical protein